MRADQQRWRIHLQAKSQNFDFKLKASTYLPTYYNFIRFSLFLNISHLLIRVSSDNIPKTTWKSSLKSRISGAIARFRSRTIERKPLSAHKSSRNKRLNRASCESNYGKDAKAIIIHGLGIFVQFLTQLKILMERKANKLLLVLILVMVGYLLWLLMKNHSIYNGRTFALRYFVKVWNWAITQVIKYYFGL